MYFPYLRGRQFELLALRELTLKKLLSSRVIPVVEPVKLSSTLLKTMEVFVENKKELGIIWNPAVGTFEGDMKSEENDSNREKFLNLLNEPYIIKSHIMANDSKKQIEECKINEDIHENDLLIICNNRELPEFRWAGLLHRQTCSQKIGHSSNEASTLQANRTSQRFGYSIFGV